MTTGSAVEAEEVNTLLQEACDSAALMTAEKMKCPGTNEFNNENQIKNQLAMLSVPQE
jgi:hypothetical protein